MNRRDLLVSGLTASLGAALPGHALARTLEALLPAPSPRERTLFNFDWKFQLGDGNDPARDLSFGAGQDDFSKTGSFSFATGEFDDSKWAPVTLPHDWAVDLPFVWDDALQGHGYKPLGRRYPATSVGWYRKLLDIPAQDLGRQIRLQFDGAFRNALVFVNGCYLGRHDDGYTPFSFDLSPFLHYGQKNYIAVRLDASFGDGWFYEGAGLYRNVWLEKHDPLHIPEWETYVRSTVAGRRTTLNLGTIVRNDSAQAEQTQLRWEIFDASGKLVASTRSPAATIPPTESADFLAEVSLTDAALWSLESPTLYTAVASVETQGRLRDADRVEFGIRTVALDPDHGLLLNGKPVKVKGTCNHQDHAGVGSALTDSLYRFRLSVLKEMGSNAVRTSHNMPAPAWVEACNRTGMLMMCETRQMSPNPEGLQQLRTMIKRFRNAPSIFLWSMGNEENWVQNDPAGGRIVAEMIRVSHDLDPTRRCVSALNNGWNSPAADALDVTGFNYNLNNIDAYHAAHPTRACIGTETASALSTRGDYTNDKLRNIMSAYDTNKPPWGETAEQWWQFYATRDWLAGGFAWTGFDYRGEPTPYGWPSISSQFGIVDMCGFPKDTFFYYKAFWGSQPVLHLFPHWNWVGREGEEISVWVFSNQEAVELFLNGKSLGSQAVPPLGHVEWKVRFQPGAIEARATKAGRVVLTEKRETTSEAVSLKLTADRTSLRADGQDVALIRVELLDAAGRSIPTADDLVGFSVTGAGLLAGVGNGDPNCHESDHGPNRSLFNGLAQAIVQTRRTPGEIVIEATVKSEDAVRSKHPPTARLILNSRL